MFRIVDGTNSEEFDRTVLSKTLISTFTVALFSHIHHGYIKCISLGVTVHKNHLIGMVFLSTYTEKHNIHLNIIQLTSDDLDQAGSSNILISIFSEF